MRIVITGATGFIGKALCRSLHKDYELIALSRNPDKAAESLSGMAETVRWDAKNLDSFQQALDGALAVINLAGENIGSGLWTKSKKAAILQSRLNAAEAIVKAAEKVQKKPALVIHTSATGFYGNNEDRILSEDSSPGSGFLADVCQQTELTIQKVETPGTRLAIVRLGVVLGHDGGIISRLLPPFRFYLGSRIAAKNQWLSWIHIEDIVGAIRFIVERTDLKGVFNLTSPNPVPTKDFYTSLGKAMNRPVIFSVPVFMLKLLPGDMANEMFLASQRAIPQKLLHAGYEFKYPDLVPALQDIIKKSKNSKEQLNMNLSDYFENAQGTGILATANSEGQVDVAIYSRPHVTDEDKVAFIMRPRFTHDNLQSNPHAAYMFIEEGPGYKGKRLYLTKLREETDPELIDSLRRKDRKHYTKSEEKSFLVYFHIDRIRPLVGDKDR